MPSALWLVIESHSCRCGQKWTHSQLLLAAKGEAGMLGGTPTPAEADKLPVIGYDHWQLVSHSGCFRCIPLALGEGWTRPQPALRASPALALVRDRQSINDIKDELLS